MKSKTVIFLSIIIIIFIGILFFLFMGRSFFLVKHIEIKKDFNIDKNKLLSFLKIYPLRSIWEYNIEKMNNELSKHIYLKEYKINRKYPDTLVINMKIRKPIAKIVGSNGKIYYIDEQGIVFKEADNNILNIPLLIFNIRNNIKYGVRIKGKYKEIIALLTHLKLKQLDLYNSLSQIELYENKLNGVDYILYFKTMSQKVYLKNKINVDSINRALTCVLLLKRKDYNNSSLLFTGSGFVVM